jgi:Flp pilus assembly protein TadB
MKQKFYGNDERIRRQQLELISMLNRWYQVKEDLIYAFEKCSESQIGEPTKSCIKEFIIRIKGGLSTEKALELFAKSYKGTHFGHFANQIRFNLRYKGNIGELLDHLETQFMKIEEERTRRKISSSRDRLYLNAIFVLTPLIVGLVLMSNPSAADLFLITPVGRLLIIPVIMFYTIGFTLFFFASRFRE